MDFIGDFNQITVCPGSLALLWLGQAGFLLKDSEGRRLVVDPYLSHCVERLSGLKRLTPPAAEPEDIQPDVYLCTHSHDDHFDVDAAPVLMKSPKTKIAAPSSVLPLCDAVGIRREQVIPVKEGDIVRFAGFEVTVVYADHGELEPCAVGYLVRSEGLTLYFTGDTAYRPEQMKQAISSRPDVIVLPINGEFGNLNEEEAARLARDSGARVAIPSHFWTFAIHRGSPLDFEQRMKEIAPDCEARFLCIGESCLLTADARKEEKT